MLQIIWKNCLASICLDGYFYCWMGLVCPRSHLVNKGQQAFVVRAPKLWNSLPTNIRMPTSLLSYKWQRWAFSKGWLAPQRDRRRSSAIWEGFRPELLLHQKEPVEVFGIWQGWFLGEEFWACPTWIDCGIHLNADTVRLAAYDWNTQRKNKFEGLLYLSALLSASSFQAVSANFTDWMHKHTSTQTQNNNSRRVESPLSHSWHFTGLSIKTFYTNLFRTHSFH